MKIVVANWKNKGSSRLALDYGHSMSKASLKDYKNLIVAPTLPYFSFFFNYPNLAVQAPPLCEGVGAIQYYSYREVGAKYIIIGHAEQRKYIDSKKIKLQLKMAKENSLIPIFCFGEESLESKNIDKEIDSACVVQESNPDCIFVYEIASLIGSGDAILEDLEFKMEKIKNFIKRPLLYGGSVNSSNLKGVLQFSDGVILGRASLNAEELRKVLDIAKNS